MLAVVHQPAAFLEPGPQLIGDVPPDLARRLAVGLDGGPNFKTHRRTVS
jgi:hypothetical protein